VRKLGAVLMVSIAVAIGDSPHSALAKDKSTTSLFKHTATGKHYNNNTTILTPHKPKTPVTEQKPSEKSGNADKGLNNNPNSTGAGASRGPKLAPDKVGVKNISR
jgi:hypothetical protein